MKLKFDYEQARIEVTRFEDADVITTSGSIDTGSSNSTGDGWTPIEW